MNRRVVLLAMLALTGCGKDMAAAKEKFVGTWVPQGLDATTSDADRGFPRESLEIAIEANGDFLINELTQWGPDPKATSRKVHQASLVDGRLVSQGVTTVLRDDGILVFRQREFQRRK